MSAAFGRVEGPRARTPKKFVACARRELPQSDLSRPAGKRVVMGKGRRPRAVVYLLCLESRMSHAKHYAGTSVDVDRRLAEHRSGRGSKFTQAVVRAGIEMRLAATWPGRRPEEKYFKLLKNSARHCPFCREDFLARDRARREAKMLAKKRERAADSAIRPIAA